MGKKEREEKHRHREKSHKRHKHHKSGKHRHSENSERKVKATSVNVEDDLQIAVDEVDYENLSTPSRVITPPLQLDHHPGLLTADDELNVDIEADDFALDNNLDNSSKMAEEEQQMVEKPKKFVKKSDVPGQIPNVKPSTSANSNASTNIKKSKRRRDSGTSSEEERWLTAIESGKLVQVEDIEMRKMKDPKLMTARQRAMYDRNNDTECAPGFAEALIALPTGYKEKEKPQTAEEIQKAVLKSQKRKQQADEKREKDKKKTMERLLKKQETKNKSSSKAKPTKDGIPLISYKNTVEGAFIHLPAGVEFPLATQTAKEPPARQLCSIPGCGQPKVYSCSKTNVPLCSFACYRKNVQSSMDIIC